MRQYKCAVIGVGFIGAAHIEALRRLGNVSVVAVCDESGAKEKAEQFNIPFAYTSYTKMIDELELDAVHICTPNFTHYEIAKYAIEKGVNFICEKPFTTTAEQAKDLASLAKAKGVKGAVNLHNRLYPMPNEMHEMVKSGEIGEVLTVDGSYIQDWLMYETDYSWRLVGSQVGKTRAVSDIGSHLLDLAEFVTGLTITDVCAQFKTVYPTRKKPLAKIETFEKAEARAACQDIKIDTEDAAIVMLKFDNGAIGSAIVSQVFAGKKNSTRLMVAGSKASLVWDSEQLSELYIGHRDSANEILTKDANLMHKASTKTVSYPSGHVEGFPDAFKQVFKEFYHSLDNEGDYSYADLSAGMHEMILCDAIFESAQSGAWVAVEKQEI